MKILIILLLSIKVAYLLELNAVTTNHINKILISNGKKYDAEKCPYEVTTSLSTCKNATDYQYNYTCTGSLVKQKYVLTSSRAHRWLNKVNENNIKFLCSIATVAFVIALTVAAVIALAMTVVITIAVAIVFGVAVSVIVTVAVAIVVGVAMSAVVTIAVAAIIKFAIAVVTVAVAVITAVL